MSIASCQYVYSVLSGSRCALVRWTKSIRECCVKLSLLRLHQDCRTSWLFHHWCKTPEIINLQRRKVHFVSKGHWVKVWWFGPCSVVYQKLFSLLWKETIAVQKPARQLKDRDGFVRGRCGTEVPWKATLHPGRERECSRESLFLLPRLCPKETWFYPTVRPWWELPDRYELVQN